MAHPYLMLIYSPAPTLLHLCKTCRANDLTTLSPLIEMQTLLGLGRSFVCLYIKSVGCTMGSSFIRGAQLYKCFVFNGTFSVLSTLPTLRRCATIEINPPPITQTHHQTRAYLQGQQGVAVAVCAKHVLFYPGFRPQ